MQMTPHYWLLIASQQTHLHAVAASLNSDLTRILEWFNHWCMIQSPKKTKALVVIVDPGP